MALTRRDVALAGIVSFIAWGLLVQQLPFLRYLGYAFTTGSILAFLTVLGLVLTTSRPTISSMRSSEDEAVLEFLTAPTWQREISRLNANAVYRPEPLYPKSFIISDALDSLLSMALRDFIQIWYNEISPYPHFPNEVDKTIRAALLNIRDRLLNIDLTEVIVSRIVPILTAHFRDFDIAEKAVRGDDLKRVITSLEDMDLAIAKRFRGGEVHAAASFSVVDTKSLQQQHLRQLAARIVPQCVPVEQIKSRAVSVFVTEIVACAILLPTMQLISDPDMLNQIMENVGRSTLQERRTVRKLRAALEQHASPPPRSKGHQHPFPRLAPNDSERRFERFIRSLRMCDNLSDARRMRSEVTSQIKRDSRQPDHNQVYLKRLQTAKRLLDQKVSQLSVDSTNVAKPPLLAKHTSVTKSRLETAPLSQILQDASGLSYFMEYMDRQSQMTAVQFWIVVDGLRNPLEVDIPVDDDTLHGLPSWTESDRADLDQIYHAYFPSPELRIPTESKKAVKEFLAAGEKASQLQYQKARSAVLNAQTSTLEKMQKESLPSFRHSDLFYKLLTTEETSRKNSTVEVLPTPPTISRNDSLPKKAITRAARKVTPKNGVETASLAGAKDGYSEPRTSSDSSRSKPLFADEDFDDSLSQSRHSIDSDPFVDEAASTSAVEAVEAALNDIMEDTPNSEDLRSSIFGSFENGPGSPLFDESPRGSIDLRRQESGGGTSMSSRSDKRRAMNIASLGLIDADSRGTVFAGDSLFPEEEKFIEDEREDDASDGDKNAVEEIHEAAPGDLGLAEAIAALTFDIDKLTAQEAVVNSLTKKAELTNNSAELRILGKSKTSLQREIQRKELQRQQYIVQESDNSLYGKSSVKIPSTLVDSADGKEYAVYLIEVERTGGDEMQMAKWAIARRYSEFHDLNQRLRAKYPSTRHIEFPRRRVVMKLQRDFLEKRRQGLEKYLQELLLLPDVCRSRELRSFLSQRAILSEDSKGNAEHRDLISRLYSSVSEGVEDLLGNIPVLDQLSATGHNILSVATGPLQHAFSRTSSEDAMNPTLPQAIAEDAVTSAEAEAELQAYETRELEPFVKPICDIFLELFELNRGGNWLRGRAAVVVLQQLLGGTIERKIRESSRSYFLEDNIIGYINLVKDAIWPGGVLRSGPVVRTEAERAKSRREASLMLATLLPDLAANVVGRANAQTASRRIYSTFNNSRLNVHLCFTVLDEFIDILFPNTHRASS